MIHFYYGLVFVRFKFSLLFYMHHETSFQMSIVKICGLLECQFSFVNGTVFSTVASLAVGAHLMYVHLLLR